MNVLTSNGGAFAVVFALLVLAFYIVQKITKIYTEHNALSKSISTIEHSSAETQKDIAYIKGMMEFISKMNSGENSLTKAHSPISLTEKGKAVSLELKIEEKINRNWDKIRSYLDDNLKSKNAYDIQQFCIETVVVSPNSFFLDIDVDEIKNFVFKKGEPFAGYGNMIGVEIRDCYFKYKSINIDEVDKFDSAKK